MNRRVRKPAAVFLLICCLTFVTPCQAALAGAEGSGIPERVAMVTGADVLKNSKAAVDLSNKAEGYVLISYHGGKDVKIKVRITKENGAVYTYDLNNRAETEIFTFTEGDGTYEILVFENIADTKYAQIFYCSVEVALRSQFLPFLYANQFVNFTGESKAVQKAIELTEDAEGPLDAVRAVYRYVTASMTYDYELAKTLQPGYVPVLDTVLERGTGICLDYASLMTAMLRGIGVPCKLVFGYVGEDYHAWISVYVEEAGWLDDVMYFDGESWQLMDPTFAAALGMESEALAAYVGGTAATYTEKYAF